MGMANELSAAEAARRIRAGELTATALVEDCLARIEVREDEVLAWQHLDAQGALAAARARDAEAPRGVLHGLPVGFKDIIETASMPTTHGSPIFAGHRPDRDAACVGLVEAAGGIVLGKTVTTEFAVSHPGKTRNPHNPAHTPGGSSSGSAAAVADNMVPLAFGTQTGGSVLRPSSFCGVVGYKPTLGQFSFVGVNAMSLSLDTLGVHTRSVADAGLMRAAMLGAPVGPAMPERAPRIGLCRTPWWDQADDCSQAAVLAAAEAARAAGGSLVEVDLPHDFDSLPEVNNQIMGHEGRRALGGLHKLHGDLLSDEIKRRIFDPEFTYDAYVGARRQAVFCQGLLGELMADLDALLVPAAVGEAPVGLESTGNALFNRAWTTLGVPAISLPGHIGPTGLPVGAQLVAPFGRDDELLAVALWQETAMVP